MTAETAHADLTFRLQGALEAHVQQIFKKSKSSSFRYSRLPISKVYYIREAVSRYDVVALCVRTEKPRIQLTYSRRNPELMAI